MYDIYTILIDLVGVPQNDIQSIMLYMVACLIATLMFYFVLYLFKLSANLMGSGTHR